MASSLMLLAVPSARHCCALASAPCPRPAASKPPNTRVDMRSEALCGACEGRRTKKNQELDAHVKLRYGRLQRLVCRIERQGLLAGLLYLYAPWTSSQGSFHYTANAHNKEHCVRGGALQRSAKHRGAATKHEAQERRHEAPLQRNRAEARCEQAYQPPSSPHPPPRRPPVLAMTLWSGRGASLASRGAPPRRRI